MKKYGLAFLVNFLLIIYIFVEKMDVLESFLFFSLCNVILLHEIIFFFIRFLFNEFKKHSFAYSSFIIIGAISGYILSVCTSDDTSFGVAQGVLGGLLIMIVQLLIEKNRTRKNEKEKMENSKELLKRLKPKINQHLNDLLGLELNKMLPYHDDFMKRKTKNITFYMDEEYYEMMSWWLTAKYQKGREMEKKKFIKNAFEICSEFDMEIKEFLDSYLILLDQRTKKSLIELSSHDFLNNLEKLKNTRESVNFQGSVYTREFEPNVKQKEIKENLIDYIKILNSL